MIVILGSQGFLGKELASRLTQQKVSYRSLGTRQDVRSFLQSSNGIKAFVVNCCFCVDFSTCRENDSFRTNEDLTDLIIRFCTHNPESHLVSFGAAGSMGFDRQRDLSLLSSGLVPGYIPVESIYRRSFLEAINYFKQIRDRDKKIYMQAGRNSSIILCSNIMSPSSSQYKSIERLVERSSRIVFVPGGRTAYTTPDLIVSQLFFIRQAWLNGNQGGRSSSLYVSNVANVSFRELVLELCQEKALQKVVVGLKLPNLFVRFMLLICPAQLFLLISSFKNKTYPLTPP